MRVFLIQTARGLFPSSGGYNANISLLRYLASCGHSVRQFCYAYRHEVETYAQMMANSGRPDLRLCRKLLYLRSGEGGPDICVKVVESVMEDGVEFVALETEAFDEAFGGKEHMYKEIARETAEYIETGKLSARLYDFTSFLQQEIARFSPTHIISNDGLSMCASSALNLPGLDVRHVAVVHTAEQLPFGPFAGGVPGHASSPREDNLLRQLDGIWSVSNAIKQYALEFGQLQTSFFVHHPWTYLERQNHEMPVHLHNWDKRFIAMINPCAVKGLQICIDLAKDCPQYDFLMYKSWGFNVEIGKQIKALQNITVRPTCTDMEEALRDIKVLIVPSLWFEAWGIVVVEAHLRGIPVISSNAGALSEAMLGLPYIVPVNALDGKRDETGAYVVPEQDIRPWVKAVNSLMNDKAEYEKLSMKVRDTTEKWLKGLDEAALEKWLMGLVGNTKNHEVASARAESSASSWIGQMSLL
ncbi:putative Glycosyl transferase family 1 domain-containing protein [Seiridium cardinale]|uniref:Glycosyl transferase family 1 domain-containing protein n=1 Tax=Seiridium cardinale TaxID=138064 RepID=A0ABR2XQY6_9PEZI